MKKLLLLFGVIFAGCEEMTTDSLEPLCKVVTVQYYSKERLVGKEQKEICGIPPDSVVLAGIGKVKAAYFP